MAEPPDGPADDPREEPEEEHFPGEPLGFDPEEEDEGLFGEEPARGDGSADDEEPGDDEGPGDDEESGDGEESLDDDEEPEDDEESADDEESSEGDREQHLFEEPQIADPFEPHTEETAIAPAHFEAEDRDGEEAEPPPGEGDSDADGEEGASEEGGGPATELHLIGSDDEDEEFSELRYHTIEETDYLSLEEAVHTPEEIRQRRAADKAARKRAGRQRLGVLFVAVAVIVVIIVLTTGGGGSKSPSKTSPPTSPIAAAGTGPSYLAAGSSASALPSNILIADRNNGQLVAVTPKGQEIWSTPLSGPSDAYISSSGRSITVTEHSRMQVLMLGIVSHKVDYHYGHPNVAGSGVNRLHDPATGQLLPDGQLVIADKSNCRIVFVTPPSHHHVTYIGKPKSCVHNPPKDFGFPDAAFPTADVGLVVSELSPAWVDILAKDHTLVSEMQPKGLSAPYDANEYAPGKLIATNYSDPGAVEEFDSQGKVTWEYDPKKGPGRLDYPTLAQVLPDGNVLVSDARNDRVIVIDASTKKIIWQYGHTHHSGNGPGFLHTPDSAVLVPSAG